MNLLGLLGIKVKQKGNEPPQVEEQQQHGPFYNDTVTIAEPEDKLGVIKDDSISIFEKFSGPEDNTIETKLVWVDIDNRDMLSRQFIVYTRFNPNNIEHIRSCSDLIRWIMTPGIKKICAGQKIISFDESSGHILFRGNSVMLKNVTESIKMDNLFRRSLINLIETLPEFCQMYKSIKNPDWVEEVYKKKGTKDFFPIILSSELLEQLGFSDEDINTILELYISPAERRNSIFPVVYCEARQLVCDDIVAIEGFYEMVKSHMHVEFLEKFKNISSGTAMLDLVDEIIPGSEEENESEEN